MANNSAWFRAKAQDRLEDLAWMTKHGENLTGAAERLGLNREALDMWARRHAPHLLVQLAAREPIDPNRTRRNQWTA